MGENELGLVSSDPAIDFSPEKLITAVQFGDYPFVETALGEYNYVSIK